MTAEHRYRPLALVLSHHADQRDHDCNLLNEEGYNVVGFADAEDTAAWLEEETPEVAIVERAVDLRHDSIVETLEARGATLISTIWKNMAAKPSRNTARPRADDPQGT